MGRKVWVGSQPSVSYSTQSPGRAAMPGLPPKAPTGYQTEQNLTDSERKEEERKKTM